MKTVITFAFVVAFLIKSEASELYLRIANSGQYSVTVVDQIHQNKSNIFKFSGLPSGVNTILVVNRFNNMVLYNGLLSMMPNERIVAEINAFGRFTILQKIQIQEVNWYTTTEYNPYGNNNPYPIPYPNNPYPGNQNPYFSGYVDDNTFNLFINSMRNESFDSNKVKMAKSYASKSSLTASQVAQVCKEFSFDSYRLEFAKSAYATCYDKNNYFLLKDAFQFSSNYNSLLDYIN
ncbi:MAG: DUF4476 domain-containing protein [Crocinitomicaceae bacterium]|nr:DUF4476 domain-containing protein [Crocinitomicaceae bacterium]